MSFLAPDPPPMPAIPPAPPAPPIEPTKATGTRSAQQRERIRRKKGVSSTILTGPRGLLPEQMPVDMPSLMGGT